MASKRVKPVTRTAPGCAGTGLLALDVVMNSTAGSKPRFWAGGTCGNVLTILSYLGWESYPIARLGRDSAAKIIANDLRAYKLHMDFVHQDSSVQTPIIYERIMSSSKGGRTHRFYWMCPACGSWLPGYRPIRLREANRYANELTNLRCFLFDRVSPGALRLAARAKELGAIVIFEPPSLKNEAQFQKAMTICDILKYSNEHAKQQDRLAYESLAWLVIETLGEEGLRYRLRSNGKTGNWKMLSAFRINSLVDTAGAGDWCTAGIIHMLLEDAREATKKASEEKIVDAIRFGQALGALNCGYEGARGVMYHLSRERFDNEVSVILSRKESSTPVDDMISAKPQWSRRRICPACNSSGRKRGG